MAVYDSTQNQKVRAILGATTGALNQFMEFLTEDIQQVQDTIASTGLTGKRGRNIRRRKGPSHWAGPVSMNPTPAELDWLLEYISGTAKAGDDFTLSETLDVFALELDRSAEIFQTGNAKIAKTVFSGAKGELFKLTMDIVALSMTNPGSATAGNVIEGSPYVFHDVTFTLNSVEYKIDSFEVTLDQGIIADRYLNDASPAVQPEGDRECMLKVAIPFNADTKALRNHAIAGEDASIVLSFSGNTFTMAFGNVYFPAATPTASQRTGEMMLELEGEVKRSSSAEEIVFSHVVA